MSATETISLGTGIAEGNRTRLVESVLNYLGDKVIITTDDEGLKTYEMATPHRGRLMVSEEGAWGEVIGAYTEKGHLVMVARFSDPESLEVQDDPLRGVFTFSITKIHEYYPTAFTRPRVLKGHEICVFSTIAEIYPEAA
jgi:hypothetical protein